METIQNGGTIMRVSDKGKAVTLTEIEAQRQGDTISDELNFYHIDTDKIVVEQDDPERKPRGQAIAMMRAKMLDDLAAARAEVARINRNIIRFDEDFMP